MGKTALLYEVREELRGRGWLAGYYEVRRDVEPGAAVASIVAEGATLAGRRLRKALKADIHRIGSAKLSFGPTGVVLEIEAKDEISATDPYPELVALLKELGRSAAASGVGVALLIDELQVFRKRDLSVLVQALSFVRQEPIALIGAGLPYLPSEMSKANTYAERFRYEAIDRLRDSEVRQAVTEPAEQEGADWEPDAVERVVELSFGYPYFVQLYASEAWVAAADATVVTVAHVNSAIDAAQRQLDAGLYAARYDRLSETEREYVHAMVRVMRLEESPILIDVSTESERVGSGEIASELGKTINAVAPTRDRVIRKGVIHSPQFGLLEFSVPGFASYVNRRMASEGL